MKIKIAIAGILLFLIFGFNFVSADLGQTNLYFFYGNGCPHCEKEKYFLDKLKNKYSGISISEFEVWESGQNRQLLADVGEKLNVNISGVPFTVIGDKYFIGWYDESITGAAIEEAIKFAQIQGCSDLVGEIRYPSGQAEGDNNNCNYEEKKSPIPQKVSVPIFGEITIKNFSLPLLTIVLGVLDGFNPCAMWTLLFLISLLLGMKDRKRMLILGGAFIVASASVYFLFMSAWLNLLLFIGFIFWVRALIGLIALIGGGYNLKEYFINPQSGCKVINTEKRQNFFIKIKDAVYQKNFYLALGGIIILALAVNLVELICSAGLPAIYTQILTLSNLAKWQHYLYILLYVFIFMLDDLFVFFAAMVTLRMTGITTKYSRWSRLIGGILMLIIGLLLIFKPEWLMFG